jgi:periplasmic protein TonB
MIPSIAQLFKSSILASITCVVAVWLTGCSTPPPPPPHTMPPAPAPVKPVAPIALPSVPVQPQWPTSNARNAREYRVDAAKHLYKLNGARIFKGRMPPMLYAVGVLDVEVDKQGQVTRTNWVRAPGHAPEVMREIEKTVRQAAPYPVPTHLGKVVYSDVWLWHKSGRFQLDTLTEGQD